jgi:hypothetical protein
MDMKRRMLIYFFKSMLVDRKKEWDSYKMEVIIKKGEKWLLWKLIKKRNNYEIIKLENEVIIFELSLEWSRDTIWPEWSCKSDIRNFLQRTFFLIWVNMVHRHLTLNFKLDD